jgi:hypothetical protein
MHAMRAGGAPAGTRHRTGLPRAPRGRGGLRAQPRDGHRGVHCLARGVARPSAPAARRAAASPARGGRIARPARARARRRRRRASMAGQRVWWRGAARLQGKGLGVLRRGAAQLGHQRLVKGQHARERGLGAPARADRGPTASRPPALPHLSCAPNAWAPCNPQVSPVPGRRHQSGGPLSTSIQPRACERKCAPQQAPCQAAGRTNPYRIVQAAQAAHQPQAALGNRSAGGVLII